MKKLIASVIAAAAIHGAPSMAGTFTFQGSDTLSGVMTDAILSAGLQDEIVYAGGGSGKGEKALLNGEQGIAPMSREMTPEALEQARVRGLVPVAHVIALDGLAVFVNAGSPVRSIDLPTLAKVFTCTVTRWEQIPNSGKVGQIKAYRRNDASGTTDTFKHLVGVKKFGDCVTVMAETADIAEKTAHEADAIGYSGLSAKRPGNRPLAVARVEGGEAVELTAGTVRDATYPLARNLYVYEISGARVPNEAEAKLMTYLLDRSFIDPIVQDHEFYTLD